MKKKQVRLAIAPIAWTNDDLPDLGGENTFEQCVSEMALAGFTGSEVGNKYPKDPTVLKPMLDIRGVQICNQWFSSFLTVQPFEDVEKEFTAQLDFLAAMGASIIGPAEQGHSIQGMQDVAIFEKKPVFTDTEWKFLADGLNKLGAIAKKRGFKLCYHHHMGTGCQTLEEVNRLMDMTDPALVWLLYDSGHFIFSCDDPVAALKKHIRRVGHVHLKDVRSEVLKQVKEEKMSFLDAVRAGAFTIPGEGMIDFPALFAVLEENDYEGWMVVEAEQDPAKANPFTYAKQARTYIKEKTGL
ncbi:MAG: myo-inosose-2 dehydratase [Spirochaetales bacterium]|jgi:inosose dehydratase|nr:myo-inosose-2 dehydratase [Spirochaetales bacterium]